MSVNFFLSEFNWYSGREGSCQPKVHTSRSRRDSAESISQSESILEPIKQGKKFQKVCEAVRSGNSVLVLGEAGTGKGMFAKALFSEMLGEYNCAIALHHPKLVITPLVTTYVIDYSCSAPRSGSLRDRCS